MKKKEMGTSNTEEMVTISRAEYEEIKLQNQWLLEQLGLAKKKQYGTSSEKMSDELMEQLGLTFNEAEANAYGTASATAEQIRVKEHTRVHSGSVEDIIPEGLPRERVEHAPKETTCPVCGEEMEVIGSEIRKTLVIVPPKFYVREDVYPTLVCRNCERESDEPVITKTPMEPAIIPGSFASAEAISYLMIQKYVMYSPLYRIEQDLRRTGLKLSRQTMSNWILKASEIWLKPVYDELHHELVTREVLHADETTLQVLREPGRKADTKSYMWLYRTSGDSKENPIVLYNYRETRKASHITDFLEGFHGWLHADGYAGYHNLKEEIHVVGCWAHMRRKFDEALTAIPELERAGSQAAKGLWFCSKLEQIESGLKGLDPEERKEMRLTQATPVLDAMLSWADSIRGKTAPKSLLGRALHYMEEQWKYLTRYLEDGRLELTNNRAERSIKPFVIGRKNWLFANTPGGAEMSSVIYSLIETAKEQCVDPYKYLLWVFQNAPKQAKVTGDWAKKFTPAKYAKM